MNETDQERIARLERKVEALEGWVVKVAPLLKRLQEAQRAEPENPFSAFESLLGRKAR